jgi:hypothetical protein
MVTDDELHFLETYARFSYTGAGKIIDLGCWLGASAGALARGLRDNSNRNRFEHPIESYDQFLWQDWMTPIAQAHGLPAMRAGADFSGRAAAALREWSSLVQIRRADLSLEQAVAVPIEFLMIDAMKSWPLANAISRSFLPKLIPGRSLVVQQDFGHHHQVTATNHIFMWRLREWFQPVHQVPGSTSFVFFFIKPLTVADIPQIDPAALAPAEIDDAFRHSLGFARPEIAWAIRHCKLLFLLEQWRFEQAMATVRDIRDAGAPIYGSAWSDTVWMLAILEQQPALPPAGRAVIQQVRQLFGLPNAG